MPRGVTIFHVPEGILDVGGLKMQNEANEPDFYNEYASPHADVVEIAGEAICTSNTDLPVNSGRTSDPDSSEGDL